MSHWKFAVPAVAAALFVPGSALAALDFVEIYNADKGNHVVTIHTGDHNNCDTMTSRLTQAIPGKSTWKLKIKNEKFVCAKRPGGKWYIADLRGQKKTVKLSIDD
jgi:hypothetical protein